MTDQEPHDVAAKAGQAVPDAPALPDVESPPVEEVLGGVPSREEIIEGVQSPAEVIEEQPSAAEIVEHQPSPDQLLRSMRKR